MSILPAQLIRARKPISPLVERAVAYGMSYGLGPAGYDVRIAEDVRIEPGSFVLASTVERFDMPADLIAFVHDKSTWARQGIALQNTVIEPGWNGWLTLEITNHKPRRPWWKFWAPDNAVCIKAGTPIAQIVFHKLEEATERAYAGKYQNQAAGPQAAIFESAGGAA